MTNRIYKITEASEYLGVSINTLKTLANNGKVKSFKTSGEHRRFRQVTPIYVFAENVSAAAIERAATDLTALGYNTDMLSLSARDLGSDHVRARYWLLAYADDKSKLRSTINAKARELPGVRESVWSAKPGKPGVVDGPAGRMERYRAVGNGQVPVVAAAALWALANAD